MERFAIWEGHMDALKKKVKRIENKCEKYGCDFHFEEVGEEFREVEISATYNDDGILVSRATGEAMEKDEKGRIATVEVVTCRFILVDVEGIAIINDWELVAFTEHTDKGNIYSKVNAEVEIPSRYRASDCFCEHCNTRRARKNTCIVRNINTNEFKQVGNTCLKDFTRGMDASIVTMFASFKEAFEEAQEAPIGGCGWRDRYLDKMEMLRYTAETIRHFGYAKSESAHSTKSRMLDYYNVEHGGFNRVGEEDIKKKLLAEMKEVGFNSKSEEAKKMAEDALAWIAEQEAKNDYMHNLKVVASLEYIGWSNLGILVSLFPTHDREMAREAERRLREEQRLKELEQGKLSDYVGEVGKRITRNIVSGKVVTSWTNCYDGWHETTTFMYKFVDDEGNILIWKTSSDVDEHKVKQITGTVKEHNEFREVKQTILTRCKVAC